MGAAVPEATTAKTAGEAASVARDDLEAGGDSAARDTLYYDGQCPLCAAEIEALATARGDSLRLVDIHDRADDAAAHRAETRNCRDAMDAREPAATSAQAAARHAPSADDLLRTLHLQRADGTWLTGADANVAAWEDTRRGRLLRVLRWPLLRPFVDLGYRIWAFWRYRRLYGRQFDTERHAPRSNGD